MQEHFEALIKAAEQAREQAYAPYSNYTVGAALLTKDGEVFTGANVENASFGATICAERVALAKAVCAGKRKFTALAVFTENLGTPCGICRQSLSEFGDLWVIMAAPDGRTKSTTLSKLLPDAFKK